jgi:RimJ/RimL family protein N-acetyltransferase
MEPLALAHVRGLWPLADPDILKMNISWTDCGTIEKLQAIVQGHINRSDFDAYAMVLTETNQAIGSSSYLDKRFEHRAIEIGSTWIGAPFQRTFVNPESKYLMLKHAFEQLGCIRVQLKTDELNIQSQKAMEKLGCIREGTLRHHMVCPDGRLRSTVFYSILIEEWPGVKQRLIERLGYEPGVI